MRRSGGPRRSGSLRSGPGRAAAAVALLLAVASPAGATERVRAFEAAIALDRHDAFTVIETIRYDFGAARRHGIVRRIPVRYGRGAAADYRIGVTVEAVDDGTGRPRPFRTTRRGREVEIRIGDPARTVTGEHTYRLRYRVTRGTLYFPDHDELYWNVTGTEWPVPIDAARATVALPVAADPAALRARCFTGPQGATGRACRTRVGAGGREVAVESAGPLAARSGLTLVVGLPKGVLVEPPALARFWSRLGDWLSPLYLLPLAALAGMWTLWRRWGRDPAGRAAIAVRYEPPADMTPAEMGTVLDETANPADLTATVLDLAVRGFLRIEEREGRGFLFLNHRDYELVRLPPPGPLRGFEAALLAALFGEGDRVRVSDLKNRFYKHVPALTRALYEATTRRGWFATSPARVRTGWQALGGGMLVLAVAVAAHAESFTTAIPIALAGAIVLVFAPFMPRRTRAGRRAYEEILGFKEFCLRVDKDRLERTGGRTAERFERVLPYAVVLGVADEWAEAFADVYTAPPTWYAGGRADFDPRAFVSDVGRSMQTLGTTMTSRPSGSGSSGFSSGGGFSGGGFGGGGGGSW